MNRGKSAGGTAAGSVAAPAVPPSNRPLSAATSPRAANIKEPVGEKKDGGGDRRDLHSAIQLSRNPQPTSQQNGGEKDVVRIRGASAPLVAPWSSAQRLGAAPVDGPGTVCVNTARIESASEEKMAKRRESQNQKKRVLPSAVKQTNGPQGPMPAWGTTAGKPGSPGKSRSRARMEGTAGTAAGAWDPALSDMLPLSPACYTGFGMAAQSTGGMLGQIGGTKSGSRHYTDATGNEYLLSLTGTARGAGVDTGTQNVRVEFDRANKSVKTAKQVASSLAMEKTIRNAIAETDAQGNAKDFADGMSLEQIRNYLELHGFLHVTPRYNVERVQHHNFYDLVVLEVPGNCTTGLVWKRKFQALGPGVEHSFTLQPHQLVQLSLDGALITGEREGNDVVQELLSLEDLITERDISENVRKLNYFKFYRESRVFGAWKTYLRSSRIARVKAKLYSDSVFANSHLTGVMRHIRTVTTNLSENTEIFAFGAIGSQLGSTFIASQISAIKRCEEMLCQQINELGQHINDKHTFMTGDEALRVDVARTHALHPYLPAEQMGLEINWSEVRSMRAISERIHRMFERVLYVAHFMFEHALSIMMERFWIRMLLQVRGIAEVSQATFSAAKPLGYWGIQAAESKICVKPEPEIVKVKTEEEDPNEMSLIDPGKPVTVDKHLQEMMADIFVDGVRTDGSYDTTLFWENQGSHIHLNIALCFDNDVAGTGELFIHGNFQRFRVRTLPAKYPFLDSLHSLIGALGSMLEKLPKMNQHHLVTSEEMICREDPALLAVIAVESSATPLSSVYFSHLHMHGAIAFSGGGRRALEWLQLSMAAHTQASDMDIPVSKLQDCFRKLHGINSDKVCQDVQKSLLVSKILEILESPEVANDIKRGLLRDRSRYHNLVKAVGVLASVRDTSARFHNCKHPVGYLTSFRPVQKQMSESCAILEWKLFNRLPGVYAIRTNAFTETLYLLTKTFSIEGGEFDSQISLLRKLKNFELSKDAFDLETEICEGMYSMLVAYRKSDQYSSNMADQVALKKHTAQIANSKHLIGDTKRDNPNKVNISQVHQAYETAREKLLSSINRGKSLLMGMLGSMKGGMLDLRKKLHASVSKLSLKICGTDPNDRSGAGQISRQDERALFEKTRDMNPTVNLMFLEKHGENLRLLKKDIQSIMDTQVVLLDAHDVIGSAAPVLLATEMDLFPDMAGLEAHFGYKFSAWSSIKESLTIKRQILASKLKGLDVWGLNRKMTALFETYAYLVSRLEDGPKTLTLLKDHITELKPKVEVVTYLSTACLRPRHWAWLSENVFEHCGLQLKFAGKNNEIISVIDISGRQHVQLGEVSRLNVADIAYRGMERYLKDIRRIVSDAAIEGMIEETLDCIEGVMVRAKVSMSMKWLRESRMREKISFDLAQGINLQQNNVLFQYCRKTVQVLMNTSNDVGLVYLNDRLKKMDILVQRMERFVDSLYEIQYKWIYVFHFVKFSAKGELDRDSARLFQMSSEELKKIEMALQQNNCSLYQVCHTSKENVATGALIANDNLTKVMGDSHSYIQSLLDVFPRFSLLPYNKMAVLVKLWLVGPHTQLPLLSNCMSDLFEGVSHLKVDFSATQRRYMCTGFVSNDHFEVVDFAEEVPFTNKIEDFFLAFEFQLRSHIALSCDKFMLNRVQKLQSMLGGIGMGTLLQNAKLMFAQRLAQLMSMSDDHATNQSYVLSNISCFCEDLWFCLGHSIGSVVIAIPSLENEHTFFSLNWRILLGKLLSECKDNVAMFLGLLRNRQTGYFNMKTRKARALISALFVQEVGYVRTLNYLITYKMRESAGEYWAGRYQLLYLFNKSERFRLSPFDVTLGCVTVPYGLEYHGGLVRIITDEKVESALQNVLGSAACFRTTVLVSREDMDKRAQACEIDGEFTVSSRDLASALGRIFTTLSSVQAVTSVQLFMSRLVYLNAFGCIDFTSLNKESLQIVMQGLDSGWRALREQNFSTLQKWLRYPIETSPVQTDAQMNRSKASLTLLREDILFMMKHNVYAGVTIVGVASETLSQDTSVLECVTKSNFNLISMNHAKPLYELGILLSVQGYIFGMEIQSVFQHTMQLLRVKYGEEKSHLITKLCCTSAILALSASCGRALLVRLATDEDEYVGQAAILYRARVEMECFAAVHWEQVLLMNDTFQIPANDIRKHMFNTMQARFDTLYPKTVPTHERRPLIEIIGGNSLVLSQDTKRVLSQCARELGAAPSQSFLEAGSRLWQNMSEKTHCLVVLSGANACGKTTLRNAVLNTIRKAGSPADDLHANGPALHDMRATNKLLALAEKWVTNMRKYKRLKEIKLAEEEKGKTLEAESSVEDNAAEDIVHVDDGMGDDEENNMLTPDVATFQETHDTHARTVISTVIYHASLSTSHLLGSFNEHNHWEDGILLRKLRQIDDDNAKTNVNTSVGEHDPETAAMHVVVLDGPMGFHIEQMFAASYLHIPSASILRKEINNNRLVMPSGELYKLSNNTILLLETADVSNASPQLLVHSPHVHLSVNPDILISQVMNVWFSSLRNWLGHFAPYTEMLAVIENVLRNSRFVHDIVGFDELGAVAVNVARVSTMLRILEEALVQIHKLTVSVAKFVKADDDEESDTGNEADAVGAAGAKEDGIFVSKGIADEKRIKAEFERDKFTKRIMTLSPHGRDQLMARVKVSIAYSAVWGVGGAANCTPKRKFFDTVVRDAIEQHLGSLNIDDSGENILDLVLNIESAAMVPALSEEFCAHHLNVPKHLSETKIRSELLENQTRLSVKTSSHVAVESILRLLLGSGGHTLLLGPRGCGKTTLINDILTDLQTHNPTPKMMRQNVVDNLLEIVTNPNFNEGIGSTLTLMRKVLVQLETAAPVHDNDTNFLLCWQVVQNQLGGLLTKGARAHCAAKTVFSASTTLRSTETANSLRKWLQREFGSEVNNVLETPRYAHGLAFVDDLHLCMDDEEDESDGSSHIRTRSINENRPENLIKGMLDQTPLFGIKKNTAPLPPGSPYGGRPDGNMSRQMYDIPIVHRPVLTDPRRRMLEPDDYQMQRVGIVGGATAEIASLARSENFSQMLKNFNVIGIPSPDTDELHVALISGAVTTMKAGLSTIGSNMADVLRPEICELSRILISCCGKMVGTNDATSTTGLEKALRNLVVLDADLVSRFCLSLRHGAPSVSNKGGLVELFSHEFSRHFLDPLPDGTQRDRLISLYRAQLELLDPAEWYVSDDWLKSLINRLGENADKIWTSSKLFCRPDINVVSSTEFGDDERKDGSRSQSPVNLPLEEQEEEVTDLREKNFAELQKVKLDPARDPRYRMLYIPLQQDAGRTERWRASIRSNQHERIHNANRSANADLTDEEKEEDDDHGDVALDLIREGKDVNSYRSLAMEELQGDSLPNSVLYPSALSMLLRLVRVIDPMQGNILLGGFYGTTRLVAVQLAAKLLGLEVYNFDVKESMGATEMFTSARANSSINLSNFLKSTVLSVCGFQEVTDQLHPADNSDINQRDRKKNDKQSETDKKNEVGNKNATNKNLRYCIVEPVKALVVIQGGHQLNMLDRRILLGLIDYENPTVIFSDSEILEMSETLRQANAAAAIDAMEAATAATAAAHAAAAEVAAAEAPSLQQQALEEYEEYNGKAVPALASIPLPVVKVPVDTRSVQEKEIKLEELLKQSKEQDDEAKKQADEERLMKSKDLLNGYSFQWVKRYLQESMKSNVSFVLDCDMPRALRLISDTETHVNAALGLRPLSNAGKPEDETKQSEKRAKPHLSRKQTVMRFNPLTVAGAIKVRKTNIYTSPQHNLLPSASAKKDNAKHGDGNSKGASSPDKGAGSSGNAEEANHSDVANLSAFSIFTCPIIGPMLKRRFHSLWWDIDGIDAVCGITHTLLRDADTSHRGLCSASAAFCLKTGPVGVFYMGESAPGADKQAELRRNIDKQVAGALAKVQNQEALLAALEMNVHVACNKSVSDLLDFVSCFGSTGIFKSFAVQTDTVVKFQDLASAQRSCLRTMLRDSKVILPELLCLKSVSDALFLTEPSVRAGPERLAELASLIVVDLLQATCRVFITRRHVLNSVVTGIDESLDVVARREHFEDWLSTQRAEIKIVVHDKTLEKAKIDELIVNVERDHSRLPPSENFCMANEDICSTNTNVELNDDWTHHVFKSQRRRLDATSAVDWESLAAMYTISPSHELTVLMRAAMAAIHYEPPRFLLAKGQASLEREGMTDLEVQRHGAMLIHSRELSVKLLHVDPKKVKYATIAEVRGSLMELDRLESWGVHVTKHRSHDGNDEGSGSEDDEEVAAIEKNAASPPHKHRESSPYGGVGNAEKQYPDDARLEKVRSPPTVKGGSPTSGKYEGSEKLAQTGTGMHGDSMDMRASNLTSSAPARLKRLLDAIVQRFDSHSWTSMQAQRIENIEKQLPMMHSENMASLKKMKGNLVKLRNHVEDQLHQASQQSVTVRAKLETLHRVGQDMQPVFTALQSAKTQAAAELHVIAEVLDKGAADACVAAAVFVRAAWLPEQVRQECMEQFRQYIGSRGISVSDSPFLMGCFTDRMQIRDWTIKEVSGITRDPASINAMHLANLSPLYTFIVDQEGVAEEALQRNSPEGYDICTIAANRFSLAQLEAWVAIAEEEHGENAALSIIITNVQAGATDDLLAFLAAELHVRPTRKNASSEEQVPGLSSAEPARSAAALSASAAIAAVTARKGTQMQREFVEATLPPWQLSVHTHKLYAALNPVSKWDATANAATPEAAPREGNKNPLGPAGAVPEKVTPITGWIGLCRIRVTLLSTCGPAMDAAGQCRPLPTACLRHISVVQWPCSVQRTHYVEAKPTQVALDKGYVADMMLCTRMSRPLLAHLSPDHTRHAEATAKGIIELTNTLYNAQNTMFMSIYTWMDHDRPDTFIPFTIPDLIFQPAVPIGILHYDIPMRVILSAGLDQQQLCLELDAFKSEERELVAYRRVLTEVFSMGADFLRMAGAFLPVEIFPPHAMATRVICNKGVAQAMEKAKRQGIFTGLPQSLYEVHIGLRGVVILQRHFRKINAPGYVRIPTPTKPARVESEDELSGLEATSIDDTDICIPSHIATLVKHKIVSRPSLLSKHQSVLNQTDVLNKKKAANAQKEASAAEAKYAVGPKRVSIIAPYAEVAAAITAVQVIAAAPKHRVFGINAPQRREAQVAFAFMTRRLRGFFLREMVNYIQSSVRPGLEWVVKLTLLLTTFTQSTDKTSAIPTEELRTLFNFINKSIGQESPRYCHYVAFKRDLSNGDRHVTHRDSGHLGTVAYRQSGFHTGERHAPNTRHRIRHGEMRWLSRGYGDLDGVSLNRFSPRWKMQLLTCLERGKESRFTSHFLNPGQAANRSDAIYVDTVGSDIVIKNAAFRPQVRAGDSFETNWLQAMGVKLFASAGEKAAMALGATAAAGGKHGSSSRMSMAQRSTVVATAPSSPRKVGNGRTPRSIMIASSPSSTRGQAGLGASSSSRGEQVNLPLGRLLNSNGGRLNFHLLSSHQAHSSVFKNMAPRITEKISAFSEWKRDVSYLSKVDMLRLEEEEMIALITAVQPPSFDIPEEGDEMKDEGSWLKGAPLTVIQTMLLSESFHPGSSGNIAELLFAVISTYMESGGRIVQHQDEIRGKEHFDKLPGEMDDEDGLEEEDEDDVDEDDGNPKKTALLKKKCRDDDNDEEDDDEEEDGDFNADETFADLVKQKEHRSSFPSKAKGFESGTGDAIWNNWGKLLKVICGEVEAFGPEPDPRLATAQNEQYQMNSLVCRDYEDWEGVLLDVLTEEYKTERFSYMHSLTTAINSKKNFAFLTSEVSSSQMFALSRRVRDLNATSHGQSPLPIVTVNAKLDDPSNTHATHQKQLQKLHHMLRQTQQNSRSNQVLLEGLQLSAPSGNATLMNAMSASSTAPQQILVRREIMHADSGIVAVTAPTQSRRKPPVSHVASLAASKTGESRRGSKFLDTNTSKDIAPAVVVATTWGAYSFGCGPSLVAAELGYAWLPRFFAQDVICQKVGTSHAFLSRVNGLPPSGTESRGMLSEELQSNYLWVVDAVKMLARSSIAPALRERIRDSSDIQLRAVTCTLTIWRLTKYLRSSVSDSLKSTTQWSDSSNHISLWQLVRLILKVSDILAQDWILPSKTGLRSGRDTNRNTGAGNTRAGITPANQRNSRSSMAQSGGQRNNRTSMNASPARSSSIGPKFKPLSTTTEGSEENRDEDDEENKFGVGVSATLTQKRMLGNQTFVKAVTQCSEAFEYSLRHKLSDLGDIEELSVRDPFAHIPNFAGEVDGSELSKNLFNTDTGVRVVEKPENQYGGRRDRRKSTAMMQTHRRSVLVALQKEHPGDKKLGLVNKAHAHAYTAVAAAIGFSNTASSMREISAAEQAHSNAAASSLQIHHTPAHALHGRVKDMGVGEHVVAASKLLGISGGGGQAGDTSVGEAHEPRVSTALESLVGPKAKVGEFVGSKNPLAAFRDKKAKERGKLDDSVRDLLDSLSSVERFTDKNASKSGSSLGKSVGNVSSHTAQEEAELDAAEAFVPDRLKVMSALYLAELAPQLKYLPAEDRERLLSLCGDASTVAASRKSSKGSKMTSGSQATLSLSGPQIRRTLRPTEILHNVAANAPAIGELHLDDHAAEEQLLRALQLPPLLAELNDVCMDGMGGADIVMFLVEWTCAGMNKGENVAID